MPVSSLQNGGWGHATAIYTPKQASSQDDYLARKAVARGFNEPGHNLTKGSRFTFKRFQRAANQAVETPLSNVQLFKKTRISSEQKLGQAALFYLMEKEGRNQRSLSDKHVIDSCMAKVHPGPAPGPNASEHEKLAFMEGKRVSDEFWNEFLDTPAARKVLNSTSYLHTHAAHANGFATRLAVRIGRIVGELGHLGLAPSSVFTKAYRCLLNQNNKSAGLFKSVLYVSATLTTLSLILAWRSAECFARSFSAVVLVPLYSSAAAALLIAKSFDALSFRLMGSGHKNSRRFVSIRDGARNRLAEQLIKLAKAQNHFATKTSEEDKEFVKMGKHYTWEKRNKKVKSLTGQAGRLVSKNANTATNVNLNGILTEAKTYGDEILFAPGHFDQEHGLKPGLATPNSVFERLYHAHRQGLDRLDQFGLSSKSSTQQLVTRHMRSLNAAVSVFSGSRAKGILSEHARAADFDRMKNGRIVNAENYHPDRQIREHLEDILSYAYDAARLQVARGLCALIRTHLSESARSQRIDSYGCVVQRYNWLQRVVHGFARALSTDSEGPHKKAFRDTLPNPMRNLIHHNPRRKTYGTKSFRSTPRSAPKRGTLADLKENPWRYNKLSNRLSNLHHKASFWAERYVQPQRGIGGRSVDKWIIQNLTGSLGAPLSHALGYAASVSAWAFLITPNAIIQLGMPFYPEFLGGGLIPTAAGFLFGSIATLTGVAALVASKFGSGQKPDWSRNQRVFRVG